MPPSGTAPKPAAHQHDLSRWQHSHAFDSGNRVGEARTHWVLGLTLVTMAAEIAAGWWSGSMALLADGWHMGTHALALAVAAFAYALARHHRADTRYAFGTWKIEVLGSFASALVLGVVAIGIGFESLHHWWRGDPIDARMALVVAVVGLVVNLVSAWLLHAAEGDGDPAAASHSHAHHAHGHDHHHAGSGHQPNVDLNLRAAYVHVLTDALTSVLAIGALAGAMWLGWWWLDPLVGIVGAVVIAVWAAGLLRQASAVLLDREMDDPIAGDIRRAIEADGDAKVADLHVWRVGRGQFAAVVTVVADAPCAPSAYRERLTAHAQLVHLSLEVNRCPGV